MTTGFGFSVLSSRTCFGISVFGLENLGFKAPPCGRGSLLSKFQELIFKSAIKDHLNKESDLMAVCVMPDHIHLLLAPISKNLIDLIGEWKGYTTHLLKSHLKTPSCGRG